MFLPGYLRDYIFYVKPSNHLIMFFSTRLKQLNFSIEFSVCQGHVNY